MPRRWDLPLFMDVAEREGEGISKVTRTKVDCHRVA